jgi:hypothetical protein
MSNQLMLFFTYLAGPLPRYLWCETRSIYRRLGDTLLPGGFESFLPSDYPLPPLLPRSLYGDVVNYYHYTMHELNASTRRGVLSMKVAFHSPVTYGVCPDDPDYYYYHKVVALWCIVVFLCAVVFWCLYQCRRFPYRYYASLLLWLHGKTEVDNSFYRSAFSSLECVSMPEPDKHSHPKSASMRNSDSMFLKSIALLTGCEPYFVQASASDQRHGYYGSREYYWAKDVQIRPSNDIVPHNAMFAFVDVDQYVDMPYFLAHNDRPVAIATVQPTVCAHSTGEFAFTFDADSVMHYYVSGGAEYHHMVWDYNTDSLLATAKWCGIPYSTTVYNVDRRTTSLHHDVIYLTPSAHWNFLATLATCLFSAKDLKRFDLLSGTHLRMFIKTDSDMLISTALPGQYACATVPAALDNTINNLAVVSKNGLTRAAVESHLPVATTPEMTAYNREVATVLYDYYTHNVQRTLLDVVTSSARRSLQRLMTSRQTNVAAPVYLKPSVRRYQYGNYDVEAKPSLIAFMSPIIDNAFAPDRTIGNEERARKKRIEDVRSNATLTPFLLTVITEFLEQLIPVPGLLNPLTHDDVRDRQFRPSQVRLINEADDTGNPKRIARTFIKSEAYNDAKEPRLITTYNSKDKVEYSRYLYAVSDWLKTVPSYAFGKNPYDIASAVATLCMQASTVEESDFSKFDGTISPAARSFEEALLYRLFAPAHHSAVQELHKAQYNLFAVCTLGTSYHMNTSRGSGSPETSAFNTMVNMFSTYLAHRMSKSSSRFMGPCEAFVRTMRGLYGGDDGLSPDLDSNAHYRACKLLGLDIKVESIPRGRYVKFLARIYGPDVWTGDSSNCCDVKRQLSKIHTSVVRPENVSNQQMLVDKMIGYTMSDANTPIVGPLALRVMAVNSGRLVPDTSQTYWLSNYSHGEQVFDNPPREWYASYVNSVLPDFSHSVFNAWLDSCLTMDDFLSPPLCVPPALPTLVDVPLVVDGELYPPITRLPTQNSKISKTGKSMSNTSLTGYQRRKASKSVKDADVDHTGTPSRRSRSNGSKQSRM